MTGWPHRPVIYEVNTAVWLNELSTRAGHRLTLADVSAEDWATVTPAGADAVWLMGVWQRSPAGLAVANANSDLQQSFRDALPDLSPSDIIGSPYCVRGYQVDALFGGDAGLAAARAALADRGVRLVLDYVPNHVAPDHAWVLTEPELFVHGDADDLAKEPAGWAEIAGRVLAHGRDPYFPPWPDVLQLNAFSPALRAATARTLGSIADRCDGIRCDMAMLMTNAVFGNTWRGLIGPAPEQEFWPQVLGSLRAGHPDTVLIAEAYWDMEWTLQQQGFDFCYDKRLYDRMLGEGPESVHGHLQADLDYQAKLVRFLENHDEPRVASKVAQPQERAAAVAIATLPGATLWHEGQFEGRQVRPPVFLNRRPDEPLDIELADWYRQLLAAVDGVRDGDWRLLAVDGWPDNQSCRQLLAWCWDGSDLESSGRHVTVVNYADQPAQGRVRLDLPGVAGAGCRLTDLLTGEQFDRSGDELAGDGLYVELAGWQCYLLRVEST